VEFESHGEFLSDRGLLARKILKENERSHKAGRTAFTLEDLVQRSVSVQRSRERIATKNKKGQRLCHSFARKTDPEALRENFLPEKTQDPEGFVFTTHEL
jgi:hypothetical protein